MLQKNSAFYVLNYTFSVTSFMVELAAEPLAATGLM
jgi:hypothetical protein